MQYNWFPNRTHRAEYNSTLVSSIYGQQLSAGYGGTCMAVAVDDGMQLKISCFPERTFSVREELQ